MEEVHQKLVELLKRRNTIVAEIQRHEGVLDAAKKRLESLDAECRQKGINPNQLDETIQKLSETYTQLVSTLEETVLEAESALASFTRREKT